MSRKVSIPLRSRVPAGVGDGFTLVELLVVIAIVGILAALLLPTMTKARDRAHGVVCVSNVRQLMLGWLLYEDATGRLAPTASGPWSGDPSNPGWTAGTVGWSFTPPEWVWMRTNTEIMMSPGSGKIGPYVRSPGVYRCPGDRSGIKKGTTTAPYRVRSYSMNLSIGSWPSSPPDAPTYFGKMADFRHIAPANVWVLIEEHPGTINDGRFEVMWPANLGSELWTDYPASRHGRTGSVSFADGHVEARKWLDGSTIPEASELDRTWSHPVPGSRDFRWLHDRTRSYGDRP